MDDEHPMRAWRRREGKTLSEVAEAVGIMPSHLSYIERRRRRPGLRISLALATLSGLRVEDFVVETKR